jgi:S1-C subfamily serine protease
MAHAQRIARYLRGILPAMLLVAGLYACAVAPPPTTSELQPQEARSLPVATQPAAQRPPMPLRYENAARLLVMIEATVEGHESLGAGIVFAISGDKAYVLTANHVVRSLVHTPPSVASAVEVRFKDRPDRPVPAKVLDHQAMDLDLTVLEVSGIGQIDLEAYGPFPFDIFGRSDGLERGDPVYPIGYPGGYGWGSPIHPDRFDRFVDQKYLYFQSPYVQLGHSGGGLFTADWRLIGIVLAVAQAPNVRAVRIEQALHKIQAWGFHVGTSQAQTPQTPLRTATAEAVKDERGADGIIYRRQSSWGGLTGPHAGRWIRLDVVRVHGLPPVVDASGDPEFALVVSNSEGVVQLISLGKPYLPNVLPVSARDVDGALVHVIEDDTTSPDDEITIPVPVSLRQLLNGQQLRLPYTNEVVQEVGNKTSDREVRLFIQAHHFSPEAHSGPDQHQETANAVRAGMLTEEQVSFDTGDATDHLVLNIKGEPCDGLLLLHRVGTIGLTSSARGAESSLSFVLYRPAHRDTSERLAVELYEIHCDGQPTTIRVQAEAIGSYCKYAILANSIKREPVALNALLTKWLDYWTKSQLPWLRDRDLSDEELKDFERSLSVIRAHTSDAIEDLIQAYNVQLEHAWENLSDHPILLLLEAMIARQLISITEALGRCCKAAASVRFLVHVLRAEAGLSYDRSALIWAAAQTRLPDSLRNRIGAISRQGSTN